MEVLNVYAVMSPQLLIDILMSFLTVIGTVVILLNVDWQLNGNCQTTFI